MREQIVGLFVREGGVVEAARMLHAAGCSSSNLDLVSQGDLYRPELHPLLRHVRIGRLFQRPEGMWPSALRWGLIGSVLVEIPVLIWVLLAFESWGVQVLLAATLWKIGTMFGSILGAIAGKDQGLESRVARGYEANLAQGSLVLAARVNHWDAPHTRGILIESGAYDVRNVEGRFVVRRAPGAQVTASQYADSKSIY